MAKTGESDAIEPFPSIEPEELIELAAEHTQVYNNDAEPIRVKFTEDTSHITPRGTVNLNPVDAYRVAEELDLTEKEAVRVLLDTLSHEVEHYNESDLESKKDFTREYPHAPNIAGAVMNIVEDCYIDHKRLKRFEGLKKPFDHATEAHMPHYLDIDETDIPDAAMKTLTAVFRTGSKPDDLESDFMKEFADKSLEWRERTVQADKQEERVDIADEITATILDNVEFEEPPEIVKEFIEMMDDLIEELEMEAELLTEEEIEELEEEDAEKAEEIEAEKPDEEEIGGEQDADGADADASGEDGDEDEDAESGSGGDASGSSEDGDVSSSDGAAGEEGDGEEGEETTEGGGEDGEETDKEDGEDGEGSKDGDNDSSESDEDGEEDDKDTKTFSTDKFRTTEVGGGSDGSGVIPGELSASAMRDTENTAEKLSQDVIEALEEMDEDETDTREVNVQKGNDLDVKKAIRYVSGDKTSREIYRKKVREEPDNRAVGITIDASGSMEGRQMKNALEAAGAIGKAADITGDEFTANTFWSDGTNPDDPDREDVGIDWITRINEEFSMSDLQGVKTYHREPIALGLRETRGELMKADTRGEKIIFVVHDGDPTIKANGKPRTSTGIHPPAVDEVADSVEKTRELGFTVIGIAVGGAPDEYRLNEMFGEEGWFRFNSDELAEQMLEI